MFSDIKLPSAINNISHMFDGCYNAEIDKIVLHENIGDASYAFNNCYNSSFRHTDINKVFYYSDYMFANCYNFNPININLKIQGFNTHAKYMFYNCGLPNSHIFDSKDIKIIGSGSIFETTDLDLESIFEKSRFLFKNTTLSIYHNVNDKTTGSINLSKSFKNTDYIDSLMVNLYTNKTSGNVNIDFSYSFENSNITEFYINEYNSSYFHNDNTGMFKNCKNLNQICFITSNDVKLPYSMKTSDTVDSMFYGCSSLSIDLSKFFTHNVITTFGENTNLSHIFDGCKEVYSTSDSFDIVDVIKEIDITNLEGMLNTMPKIATHDFVRGLEDVIYDIKYISYHNRAIRFDADIRDYSENPEYDANGNISNDVMSKFSVNSVYPIALFPSGFLRYGGELYGENGKYFYVPYYPIVDNYGNTLGFKKVSYKNPTGVYPGMFYKYYTDNSTINADGTHNPYDTYQIKEMFLALIYDNEDNELGYRYVAKYNRLHHQFIYNKLEAKEYETIEVTSMPVSLITDVKDAYEKPTIGYQFKADKL